jgi:hypothetical protein
MRTSFILPLLAGFLAAPTHAQTDLWQLATNSTAVHRFSTLFTAQDVLNHLSSDAGIEAAILWCKSSAITHVYLEEFRDGYLAERPTLEHARDRFRAAGFLVSGCVTTTRVGKPSNNWGVEISCYTDLTTQEKLQAVFEYAAGLFDEIMIDDFFFEDCTCPNCDAARQHRQVTMGDKTYPVEGDNWADYHCALMLHLAQDRVLAAAKRVNSKVRLILKYPQWYDGYPERGYDVGHETAAFDGIWAGTETRDFTNTVHWGGTIQYEGFFLMRWLSDVGGGKCGGGWFDWLGTTEPTYIEQARQTILAGAKESMLFCYGGLNPGSQTNLTSSIPFPTDTGPADIAALRENIPGLLATAREVQKRQPLGIAAYKPLNSRGGEESSVFDFIGMMGLPLAPCHQFPANAPAAFFSLHALGDPNIVAELNDYIKTQRPVLMTDGLAKRLLGQVKISATNVQVLPVRATPDYLLTWPQAKLDEMRTPLLSALNANFRAPNQVAIYLYRPDGWVIENFNNEPVTVLLNGQSLTIAARGWTCHW